MSTSEETLNKEEPKDNSVSASSFGMSVPSWSNPLSDEKSSEKSDSDGLYSSSFGLSVPSLNNSTNTTNTQKLKNPFSFSDKNLNAQELKIDKGVDNDTIEEETTKKEDVPNKGKNKLNGYLGKVFTITIMSFLYTILGLIVLYLTKIAKSNILPTDVNCSPYISGNDSGTKNILLNIFTNVLDNKSAKMFFPVEKDGDSILENTKYMIDNLEVDYTESSFSGYLTIILFNTMVFGYKGLNNILGFIEKFNEYLIIIFGPIIFGIAFGILSFLSWLWWIVLFFTKTSWLFKDFNPSNLLTLPMTYLKICVVFWMILLVGIVGGGLITSIISIIVVFGCLQFQYKLKDKYGNNIKLSDDINVGDDNIDQEFNLFSFIGQFFKFHKLFFILLIVFQLIVSVQKTDGWGPAILMILVFMVLYKMDVFKDKDHVLSEINNLFGNRINVMSKEVSEEGKNKSTCPEPFEGSNGNSGSFLDIFNSVKSTLVNKSKSQMIPQSLNEKSKKMKNNPIEGTSLQVSKNIKDSSNVLNDDLATNININLPVSQEAPKATINPKAPDNKLNIN